MKEILLNLLIIEEFNKNGPKWVNYKNDSIKDLFELNFEKYEYTQEYFENIIGMDVLKTEMDKIINMVSKDIQINKVYEFAFSQPGIRVYVLEHLGIIYDELKKLNPTLDFKIAYGNNSLSIIVREV